MSGAWGVVVDGVAKITYCHRDAHPECLGMRVYAAVKIFRPLAWLKDLARSLRVVDPRQDASADDIEKYRPIADVAVGSKRIEDWYCLIRRLQLAPSKTLLQGIMLDASRFPEDSAQCEWAYVLDLDEGAFEVYQGEQEEPHDRGRFASAMVQGDPRHPVYPCALVLSVPIGELDDGWLEKLKVVAEEWQDV